MNSIRIWVLSLAWCILIIIIQYLVSIKTYRSIDDGATLSHIANIVTIVWSQWSIQRTVGRGLIITGGYILTSKHVIDQTWYDYTSIIWYTSNQTISYIWPRRYHNSQDLAVVGIEENTTTRDINLVNNILNASTLNISSWQYIYTRSPTGQLSTGVITETGINIIISSIAYTGLIQSSLSVSPWWSGSPVWDTDNKLVGIVVAVDPRMTRYSFIIPISSH